VLKQLNVLVLPTVRSNGLNSVKYLPIRKAAVGTPIHIRNLSFVLCRNVIDAIVFFNEKK